MIGRYLTTQNRVKPPKKPKKDKGHHKDEGNRQQRIIGKAIFFLKAAKHVPLWLSSID
jgi:hypothetical protein